MYVKLDEQHEFSLYQLGQMVIAEFFNISVKAAHRKAVTVSSFTRMHYKIIYKESARGVCVILGCIVGHILQYEFKITAVCIAEVLS